eukprot:775433_1
MLSVQSERHLSVTLNMDAISSYIRIITRRWNILLIFLWICFICRSAAQNSRIRRPVEMKINDELAISVDKGRFFVNTTLSGKLSILVIQVVRTKSIYGGIIRMEARCQKTGVDYEGAMEQFNRIWQVRIDFRKTENCERVDIRVDNMMASTSYFGFRGRLNGGNYNISVRLFAAPAIPVPTLNNETFRVCQSAFDAQSRSIGLYGPTYTGDMSCIWFVKKPTNPGDSMFFRFESFNIDFAGDQLTLLDGDGRTVLYSDDIIKKQYDLLRTSENYIYVVLDKFPAVIYFRTDGHDHRFRNITAVWWPAPDIQKTTLQSLASYYSLKWNITEAPLDTQNLLGVSTYGGLVYKLRICTGSGCVVPAKDKRPSRISSQIGNLFYLRSLTL